MPLTSEINVIIGFVIVVAASASLLSVLCLFDEHASDACLQLCVCVTGYSRQSAAFSAAFDGLKLELGIFVATLLPLCLVFFLPGVGISQLCCSVKYIPPLGILFSGRGLLNLKPQLCTDFTQQTCFFALFSNKFLT